MASPAVRQAVISGELPTILDSPTRVAGRMVAMKSPRAEGRPRFADRTPSPPPIEPLSPRYKLFGDDPELVGLAMASYDEAGMKVIRVNANALVQPAQRPEIKRRVTDKDKDRYGNGRQMRPAREMNLSSRKRLNELLQLPSMRIEAGGAHPSRSYGLIPTQNLRVV